MIFKILKIFNYIILVSVTILFIFLYMINNDYNKSKKITFLNLSIAETFYAKLPKDLSLLKANLNNMTFINQFSIDIRKDEIFINILLHVPFAFNDNDNTVIFQNGTLAKSIFFDKAFISKIKLKDISPSTVQISKSFISLLSQLNIFQALREIELIDNRRYNVYFMDGRKIMLPKIVNARLINFLNDNLDVMINDQNYSNYLDLRNFATNSIRMK